MKEVRPKKSLGQNFLRDENISRKIVALAQGERKVLENGPGQGALTRFLLQSGSDVAAIEKDRQLAFLLRQKFPGLSLVCADALFFPWEKVEDRAVIGNLPYNVASPIIWEILSRARFSLAVFMVQKEVARRLCAGPNGKEYGALSVWAQTFSVPEYAFTVSPNVFFPRPKVDSAVVSFQPTRIRVNRHFLGKVLRLLFQKRRKQIGGLLRPFWDDDFEAWLANCNLKKTSRPENIDPQSFLLLSKLFEKKSKKMGQSTGQVSFS